MIDHTAVNVSDQDAARAFYSKALEPLGYRSRTSRARSWASRTVPD